MLLCECEWVYYMLYTTYQTRVLVEYSTKYYIQERSSDGI